MVNRATPPTAAPGSSEPTYVRIQRPTPSGRNGPTRGPAESTAARESTPTSGDRPAIVIVEDELYLLEIMTQALADEDYRVVPVSDWRDAFIVVKRECPDLILLDLVAGRQETGWTVLEQLKRDPATRQLPVILTTGVSVVEEVHRLNGLPPNLTLLAKPFDLDVLSATVAEKLRSSAVGSALDSVRSD